jgi:cytochrome c-type biogenesis protein CcmF
MMHYFIGDLGHFFVILAFVASLVTFFSYFKATLIANSIEDKKDWISNGRSGFYVHSFAVIGIVVTLFIIISNHYFEYHYAYNHSDRKLPTHYLISTFWNGQEGSFLLWMFWQTVLGIILINTNRFWEAPVMTVFAIVQAFLVSMILGVVLPGIHLKLGSSPFILLREAMDAPIFKMQPEFIPKDGTGLNPLLQNYWMVIHPPTLFLGFATTLVPFSYCIAGLWLKKYKEWIRPALPWAIFSAGILGLGILMGGYWAYETLNFGGYWNWDPVENAVYVPWLILVASIHTMITYKNSGTALKSSIILVIAVFILILYSTFLTRSGILGESSVHSFTDLGLSGQLLIYLFFFLCSSIFLSAIRWRHLPTSRKEVSFSSREFWIFIGVLVLTLMGMQVLSETSKPVYNAISKLLGMEGNRAPRADAVQFYSNFQLWFAVVVGFLSGVGQFFWWKKMDVERLKKELIPPTLIALVLFAGIITVGQVHAAKYIVLTLAGTFTVVANATILLSLLKSSPGLSGGAVAHIGVGLMLLGIMASSGYSKIVSMNNTGMLISKELSDDFNRENLLLFLHEPRSMAGYDIEYQGERVEARHKAGYVDKNDIIPTGDPYQVIAKRDIYYEGKMLFKKDEQFEIYPENTFYEIEFRRNGKRVFVQYPRVQVNEQMGVVTSPDISRALTKDLYTYVSVEMPGEAKKDWSKTEELRVKVNHPFYVNDYVSVLEGIDRVMDVPGVELGDQDVAVRARIKITAESKAYYAEPVFVIKDKMVGQIPDEITDLGVRISLLSIHPETNEFTLGVNTRQKDWVVLKALEKPYINVLWIGTLVLMTGFSMALIRRSREFIKTREKGLE